MEKKSTPAIRFKDFTDPWEQRKLGDVCEELSYGVGAAAVPFDGQTRYLRITDIDDETHEFLQDDLSSPDPDFALSDNDYLKSGDIVFARTGASVGKTYLNRGKEEDIVFAGFLIRAVLQSSFDSEFIYQQTLSEAYKNFVAITSQRSGQPGINAQEYSNWDLWVCGDKEQVKIGAFFRKLDDLITLHQRKLEMMKNFKKSMLEKMFPKNGSDVPEIRFAGFTDPWEQRKLGELESHGVIYLGRGNIISAKDIERNPGNYPIYSSSAHNDGKMGEYGEYMFEKELVTWSIDGGGSVFYRPKHKFSVTNVCGYIEPSLQIDCSFLANQMAFKHYKIHFDYTVKAHPSVIRDLYFLEIPKLDEQCKIGSFFSNLDDLITLHQRKLDMLKDLKKSMLEKMFV